MHDRIKELIERIAEEFQGQKATIDDEFHVGAIIIDEFNMDPETVLPDNEIKFTMNVAVEVLLNEDEEPYYQITFQRP